MKKTSKNSKRAQMKHPIYFRRDFNSKIHNEMLKEDKLRKGTRSTKYEDVGKNSKFEEIMFRKTYINLYKFDYDNLKFIPLE